MEKYITVRKKTSLISVFNKSMFCTMNYITFAGTIFHSFSKRSLCYLFERILTLCNNDESVHLVKDDHCICALKTSYQVYKYLKQTQAHLPQVISNYVFFLKRLSKSNVMPLWNDRNLELKYQTITLRHAA